MEELNQKAESDNMQPTELLLVEEQRHSVFFDFSERTKEGWDKFSSATKSNWAKFADSSKQAYDATVNKVKEAKVDEKFRNLGSDIKSKTAELFSKNKQIRMFGGNLAEICAAENGSVPIFIEEMQTEVEKRKRTLGIFRTSPLATELEEAVKELEGNHSAKLESWPTEVIASLFKQFIKELQPGVLTEQFVDSLGGAKDVSVVCALLVERISLENVILLRIVLQMLAAVAKEQIQNMMNANNLAIIFTTNLLPESGVGNFEHIANVEWMITNAESIEKWFEDKDYEIEPKKPLNDYKWGTVMSVQP